MAKPDLQPILDQVSPGMRALLGGSSAALLLLILMLYGVKPAWMERERLLQRVESARASARNQAPVGPAGQRVRKLEREVAALEESLRGGSSRVAPREMEAHVVGSLDKISARHAISLIAVKPGVVGTEAIFEELPYEVEVSGDYFALFDWLRDVEAELRPMVVKEFNVAPSRRAGVEMQLRLVAYRPIGELP